MPRSLSHLHLQLRRLLPLRLLQLLLLNICLQHIAVVTADNWESKAHIGDFFPALNEFTSHTVIRPQVQHGRTKRALQSTLDAADGLHTPHLTLSYMHQGQRVQIELHRNDRLLPDAHFLRYQNASNHGEGSTGYEVRNFSKTDIDLCHYQGHIRGQPESSVALSTCNGGLNGVVFDGAHTYFIHPHSEASGRLQEDHYLLRHADLLQQNATCGYDSHTDNHKAHPDHELLQDEAIRGQPSVPQRLDVGEFHRMLKRKRRQAHESQLIRGPYNANKYSSYVELVIVVDNKVYKHFGESAKRVHQYCKDLANIVNALYVPLNIFVALVGVVIWNESNEIEFSKDGDVTLRNFLSYRSTKLVLDHPNDNAQLLTKETFAGGVVGKALKGPICTYEYSGGVSMQHSQVLAVVATTMAHEMGHNFGMEHDTPDCHCPDEKCVMASSSTAVVPVHWSSCSKDQLTIAFSRGMNYCLRNKPKRLFDSPQCGNGFVEPGEQCDCGLPAHCENSCCNAHTCMLHTNASCATGECCDLRTCRPKMAGTSCRPQENECDLPEYCTGESEYCPTDVFRRDTEPCDNNQAFCFLGTCRSHTNQCRTLWGPTGDNSVHCYEKNMEGTRLGNCGFNRWNNTFVKCSLEHVHCGMLHCNHLNERLEFGIESAAVLSHSFISHDRKIVACRTALVDLGLQTIDPGLAPNGAKCGDQKMCVNQQCLAVEQVRQMGMGSPCPENCNGKGICNSRGHCHCELGWAGEACNRPGHGGSVDSGPATNPSSSLSFQRFLVILFFLVLPLLAAFLLAYRCVLRKNKLFAGGKLADNILKTASGQKPPTRSNQNGGVPPGSGVNALPKSTPSSTDDMNSALLKSPSDSSDAAAAGNTMGMFGKFKGFTLRPLNNASSPPSNYSAPNVAFVQPTVQQESNGVPQRAAPPPPAIKPSDQNAAKATSTLPRPAPALPPPNPGSTARPIISKPTLDSSTLTMVPLKGGDDDLSPTRSAPAPPVPLHADPKLNIKRDGTIRRFASFLKKDEKPPLKEKTYIDRERLRTLEISAPIPVPLPLQAESSNSDSETTPREEETKNLVKRTQSMRSPTKKTQVQTFGSMRSPPGAGRPKSTVTGSGTAGSRPKSPPPRPPPVANRTNSTTSSGYQLPVATAQTTAENTYDNCEFVESPLPASNDAIYSVIDEIPPAAQTLKRSDLVASLASTNSGGDMGLLGEIVNEFEKLNGGDSIYSGKNNTSSTAATADSAAQSDEQPEIPLSPQRPAPPKPAGSNRTSGSASAEEKPAVGPTYLRTQPLNTPVARVAPTRADISPSRAFSSFKPVAASAPGITTTNNNSSNSSNGNRPAATPAAQPGRNSGGTRPKSFTKTSKALPNGTAAAPSATIQKPKPLSAKPSFSGGGVKRVPGAGTSTTGAAAPTPPTVKTSGNIASLTQRFEHRK